MITSATFDIDDQAVYEIASFTPTGPASALASEFAEAIRSSAHVVVRNLEDVDTGDTVFIAGDGDDFEEGDPGFPLTPGATLELTLTGAGTLFAFCDEGDSAEIAVLAASA